MAKNVKANENAKTNNSNREVVRKMEAMKVKYIGIGAAGNKAVMRLIREGIAQPEDTVLINSTNLDFPVEYKDGCSIVLSPGNNGCGKERKPARDYAINMLQNGVLDPALNGYSNIIIATSLEGGTGSGATPIIAQYIVSVLALNVRIFCFAGFEDDARGMQNTVEFFQELNFKSAVHVIRNSAFASNNRSKFSAEEMANAEFCKEVRVLNGQSMIASSQNMDDTDLMKVTNTCGYTICGKIEFTDALMYREEFDKLCKNMIYNSPCMPSEYGQMRLAVIMNIRPESEDAVDYNFSVLKETYGEPYETFVHRQYDDEEQYVAFIAAGMKMPLEEVKAVYEKYKRASEAVNKSNDSFFDQIKELTKDGTDSKFDMALKTQTGMDKDNFFSQL